MILENKQERDMIEEIVDVILKAHGKGAFVAASSLVVAIKKFDEAKVTEDKSDGQQKG